MIPKLVIFDCDGTIVDSQHMIVEAMETAFGEVGLARPERAAVLSVVGLSLPLAVERLLPACEAALAGRIADIYKSAFHALRQRPEVQEPLFEGMRAAILELARRDDVRLGVATGKSRRGVGDLLKREALSPHFVTIQTADTNPSKPHPGMILAAMAEAGVAAGDTVMIGDTTFDIEMAAAARVAAIGVAWGYHPVPALKRAGADAVAQTADDLSALLARWLEAGDLRA